MISTFILRQRIATAVLPQLVHLRDFKSDTCSFISPEKAARLAVSYADALIRELETTDYESSNPTKR